MLFKKKKEEETKAVEPKPVAMSAPAAKAPAKEEEIAAAISLALNIYLSDIHDYEKMVITMQRVMRPYSPWSSKIYGLTKSPR